LSVDRLFLFHCCLIRWPAFTSLALERMPLLSCGLPSDPNEHMEADFNDAYGAYLSAAQTTAVAPSTRDIGRIPNGRRALVVESAMFIQDLLARTSPTTDPIWRKTKRTGVVATQSRSLDRAPEARRFLTFRAEKLSRHHERKSVLVGEIVQELPGWFDGADGELIFALACRRPAAVAARCRTPHAGSPASPAKKWAQWTTALPLDTVSC